MSWLQINVELARPDPLGHARRLFAAIEGPFFFSRKPPDVRLRFLTDDPRATFRRLWPVLRALREEGAIVRFFRSVYEPETRLFGGARSSEAVHAYFLADTRAWIERGGSAPSRAIFADLLTRTIADRTEIWDAWATIEAISEAWGAPADGIVPPLLDPLPAEWAAANEDLAREVQAAWSAGSMRAGVRAVLAYVVMFSANRHGLDGGVTRAIARAEMDASDPHA